MRLQDLARRILCPNLRHDNTRVSILAFRETGVDDHILVRRPLEIPEALNVNGCAVALVILEQLARRHLEDVDVNFLVLLGRLGLFNLLFLFALGHLLRDNLERLFGDEVAVKRPHELLILYLLEVTNQNILSEVPDLKGTLFQRRVEENVALTRRELDEVDLRLFDGEDGLHGAATNEINTVRFDDVHVRATRAPAELLVRVKRFVVGHTLGLIEVVQDLGLAHETLDRQDLAGLDAVLRLLRVENLSVDLKVVGPLGLFVQGVLRVLNNLVVVGQRARRKGVFLVKLVAIQLHGGDLRLFFVLEVDEAATDCLLVRIVPLVLDGGLLDRRAGLGQQLHEHLLVELLKLLVVALRNSVKDDVLAKVIVKLGRLFHLEWVLDLKRVCVDTSSQELGQFWLLGKLCREVHVRVSFDHGFPAFAI